MVWVLKVWLSHHTSHFSGHNYHTKTGKNHTILFHTIKVWKSLPWYGYWKYDIYTKIVWILYFYFCCVLSTYKWVLICELAVLFPYVAEPMANMFSIISFHWYIITANWMQSGVYCWTKFNIDCICCACVHPDNTSELDNYTHQIRAPI